MILVIIITKCHITSIHIWSICNLLFNLLLHPWPAFIVVMLVDSDYILSSFHLFTVHFRIAIHRYQHFDWSFSSMWSHSQSTHTCHLISPSLIAHLALLFGTMYDTSYGTTSSSFLVLLPRDIASRCLTSSRRQRTECPGQNE